MDFDDSFVYQQPVFDNRFDAGKALAKKLIIYKDDHPVVLALPRGGVEVGYEVAKTLEAPLDVLVSRKIGAPGNPEFGIGAIAENNSLFLDKNTMNTLGYSVEDIQEIEKQEREEVNRRVLLYRGKKVQAQIFNRTVILIDDGLATGVT